MAWRRRAPSLQKDYSLDPYRNQVAELIHNGIADDYLFVSVVTDWDERSGWLHWDRRVNPREAVLWEVANVRPDREPFWTDGLIDPAAEFNDEVARGNRF